MEFLDAGEIQIQRRGVQSRLLNDEQGQQRRRSKTHEERKHYLAAVGRSPICAACAKLQAADRAVR
ncbi:hypothetical protein LP419_25660 [Massilia sp. H-1]|nr:hypothetical protein LP419_25660 [Massilia sp. H-1]